MTKDQVKLVQSSFAQVAPIADQAAMMFYDRLFEIAPNERGLGPAWTRDLAAAWTAAYTVLSDFMIAEAYGRPAAAE